MFNLDNLSFTADFILYGLTLIVFLGAGALALASLQDCLMRLLEIFDVHTPSSNLTPCGASKLRTEPIIRVRQLN